MSRVCFSDIFLGVAARHPERVAIESNSTRLTYREFTGRAAQIARDLAASGIGMHARVGISSRKNEDIIVQMCALWMLGATAVPIDFRTRTPERVALARDFELAAILEDRPVSNDGAYPSIVTDAHWQTRVAAQSADPLYSPDGDAPALIALTSGTSGARMGALIDHDHLLMRASLPAGLGQRDAGGRMLNLSPLTFCASVHSTLTQLLNLGTVVFFPVIYSTQEVSDAILTRGITSLATVPTVVRGLLEMHAERTSPVFDRLNFLYCAGAPLAPREKLLSMRVLSGHFIEIYASTLTGRICFLDSPDVLRRPETVGRVIPQANLQIVDSADNEVAVGQPGLIRVRSPGTTLRLCGSGADRQKGDRVSKGWVYTGDVGCLDVDGFLQLLGRDSEMIIRGGGNIYPAEVEAVAMELAGVREAVVVGFPSEQVGEDIAVFLIADPGVTEQAVISHFRTRLIPNKTPRVIRFKDHLPRNENGKVRYADLKQELSASP